MMHYIKAAGGAKLALHDLGGSGPPLLILHCNRHGCRDLLGRASKLWIMLSNQNQSYDRHDHVWGSSTGGRCYR